jgi:arylsulfatase A-like enzyme/chitodextrinase
VDPVTPIDAFNQTIALGTHTSQSTSVTTSSSNDWLVDTIVAGGNTGAPVPPQTQAWAMYDAGFGGASYQGPLPAGAASMSWTLSSNSAASSQIVAALRPAVPAVPPVISTFSASPSSILYGQSATLSWSVSGIPTPTLSISTIGTVAGSSVTVSPKITTTYILTATNSQGSVSASTTVTVTLAPDTTPPTVPTNLTATAISPTQITLSWSPSTDPAIAGQNTSGVAGYQIFRGGTQIATATQASYTDVGLTPSTQYSYAIAALDGAGNVSTPSPPVTATTQAVPDTTPPTVPTNVMVTSTSPTSIALSWAPSTDPDSPVGGYQIFRNGTQTATSPTSTYTDTNLTPNTTYTYAIAAFDPSGNVSSPSASISGTTDPDTIPPTVSVTTPVPGATVLGSVPISATATDNVAVASVQFFIDGTAVLPPVTTSPYSVMWDSTTVANGPHTITAMATDTSNQTAVSSPVAITVSNSTPTMAYAFDEGSGTITADTSGNNHTATLVNGPVWAAGKYGNALSFNGTSAYVDTGVNTSASAITFSAWVNISAGVTGFPRIFAKYKEIYFQFAPSTRSLQFEHMWTGHEGYWNTPANSFTTGVWHSVAVTYDSSATANVPTIYIDGVAQTLTVGGSPSGSPSTSTSNYLIGTQTSSGGYLKGLIDNVRIYSQVVPLSQIQSDLTTPVPPLSPDTSPPTVTITNPISGWTISNTIPLAATASDNISVASVRFQLDGTSVGQPVTSAPYALNLDTSVVPDGPHTITAIASDTSNNTSTASVPVLVNNTSRTNIVLILTDDQRWDQMPYLPLTTAALAPETVQFDNAFVTTPDCCPSRASILTGLYAHNHGVLQDAMPNGGASAFNPTSTIATWLQNSGYRTGLYGKYLNGYKGMTVPPGWTEFHALAGNSIGSDDNLYYNYYLDDNGTVTLHGSSAQDYSTTVLGAGAVSFINATPSGTPLYLEFTPFGPHSPATPDNPDIGLFSGVAPYRPPSFNEADVSDKPLWVQNLPLLTPTTIASVDQLHENQLETLQSVDRATANIINALKQTGRWNNTIFVFMSDNGLALGEHRMVDAKFAVYEEDVRVPLWIRAPGLQARHESSIVANIDIAPTLAQYAGITPPTPINGMSLSSLINNPTTPWRTNLLLEYIGPTTAANQDFQAVRTSQYVYSELSSGERELYDLQVDPYELTNVYNDPAYAFVIPGLQAQLASLRSQ